MVRVRKLVLAIAAASALSSGMAHALGLGEVTLQSALNQPLVAEIELLEVRDLASSEVIPTLASPEAFTKAGVDRQYFLTDLKFTPVLKPNGKSVIRVTSNKPMREPYLNFLVEVLWPNGRLLREYTLLLDPPLYSPQSVIPAAAQLPVAAPAPRVQAPATATRPAVAVAPVARPVAPAAPAAPVAPVAPAAKPLDGNEYKTTANDTLWEIAQRARAGGSVHQAMLAIQDLNPDAFVGGNINRLKNGQVLRLPDEQQVKSRSQGEAIAQVAEQNAAWREGRSVAASARQLDATKRTNAAAAPAKVETGDSLKLVAADSGKATAGSDKGAADSKALTDKLAVTQESLDSSRRENDELKGRMTDLQSQLDKLQRLIQLKDDQMAKLQADLAAQNKTPVPAAAPAAAVETPVAAEVPVTPAPAAAIQKPAATPDSVTPAATGETDFNYSEEPAAQPEAAAPVAQVPAPVVAPEPAPVAPPAPVVETPVVAEPQAESSAFNDLLANPMLLGVAGGGALLVLLVALMMLSRRNAMKEAELQESLASDENAADLGAGLDLPDDSFAGLSDDLAGQQADVPSDERVTAQTGDALGEADIYIAYGRFPQAAELLQTAINDEPQRSDLRLKLMEVYAEMGDRNGFARQDNELREIGGSAAEVDQIKAKYPAMAAVAAGAGFAAAATAEDLDSFSLDDLTLDDPAPKAPAGDQDDAFDLSLDDLESELDRDLQAAGDNASLNDLDSLSLDNDLDFSSPLEQADNKEDDLGFDLSLADSSSDSLDLGGDLADFSLDLDAPAKPAADAEDDFLLSLDDEPSATPAAAESSFELPAEETAGDFDLSADFDLSLSDEAPAQPSSDSFAAQLDEVSAELDLLSDDLDQPADLDLSTSAVPASAALDNDDDFDFLSGTDETATKLDLARAYIDMGDTEGARDILDEVITEGNEGQQQEARELIAKLV
ncbi:peptigoglycan-binding protein LysM [Pseudomonas sp. SL4(2022)]|uniref:FimV/HubP family polar landmark protein n=1 Tax=Pseudomonas sp. SL4(2022) TaxID=2994661 RepID=UPI00226D67E1|nr:FimV/HubP family polar landmark protein [Pseudomonas sp. SL4(2022)]WAC43670.1 peptigoglycan-binding protein LysM [Pseudomonas sp. SL4(2022)]